MKPKRAVIVANARVTPPRALFLHRLQLADFWIAADGGLKHFAAEGFTPHLVIGDFDSASPLELQSYEGRSLIYKFSKDKEFTDLELAIRECERRNIPEIDLFCAFDDRIDFSFGTLGDADNSSARFLIFGSTSCSFVLNERFAKMSNTDLFEKFSNKISIHPIRQPLELKTKGLRWPVDWSGSEKNPRSQSNEFAAAFEIELKRGSACVTFVLVTS